MKHLFHPNSSFRILAFSGLVTIASLIAVAVGLGWKALYVAIILVIVEVTFSFDNAIINAKILERLSPFWQKMFLTIGILIAIFGMRVFFPILIVSLTAGLGFGEVVRLALNDPKVYGQHLTEAHPMISAFGGAFLLMLAFQFFFNDERDVLWIRWIERKMQRLSHWMWAPTVTSIIMFFVAFLPMNTHARQTILAGAFGTATYVAIQILVHWMEKLQTKQKGSSTAKQVGMAAFVTFIYLQILDASFSFDGVIGAFAITNDILIIAAGLGIGAIWVRSMTVYMVRKGTLNNFAYLEHGAHYTVFVLAIVMLASALWHIPEIVPGLTGIGVIMASIAASIRVRNKAASTKSTSNKK
ncbi:DUF475 domain-containing protein [Candidatus Saccharibacteria bacterium]|nr:DUF475 domain-containing protein [Candidatus Saccharibacteria bacterium]